MASLIVGTSTIRYSPAPAVSSSSSIAVPAADTASIVTVANRPIIMSDSVGAGLFASAILNGHIMVTADQWGCIIPADPYDIGTFGTVYGMIDKAYPKGAAVSIITSGFQTFTGWNLVPNKPVYLGAGGFLVQTPPAGAVYMQVVGMAKSSTQIVLGLHPPIRLYNKGP